MRLDKNRLVGGVACYIRNDLSFDILSVFLFEIEKNFFDVLLSKSKPVIVGNIYRHQSQNYFVELLNSNMNKINSVDNEIYFLGKINSVDNEIYFVGDFNINLFLNDSDILGKKNSKSIPSNVKSYHELCTFFGLK